MGRPNRKATPVLPDYAEGIQIKTEDGDPRFNNALARGLAILRAFQVDLRLLGNLEIAEITGLAKSTVSRLTFTLTQLGYLRYREDIGKYELAAGMVGLAYPYIVNQTVPTVARPAMLDLAASSKSNIGLGIHEGLSVLYLEYALGEANPSRRQRVGFRVPLIRTAMGRACIAGMSREARARLFQQLQATYPREWPLLQRQLEDAIEQVQLRGYCVAAGTFDRHTTAVAVPFVQGDDVVVMAFNSQGPSRLMTAGVVAKNGKRLLELVERVRQQLSVLQSGPSLGPRRS